MKTNNALIKDILKIAIPLLIVIALFVSAVGVGIITFGPIEKTNVEVTATAYIDFGNGEILPFEITTKNSTAYGFLLEAANSANLAVKTTYYGEYDSIFVDSIGPYVGGDDNRYWQYYVNGEYATVGADKIIIKNGDVIEWRFEKFEY